jgi:type VI secretion system protein ImpA
VAQFDLSSLTVPVTAEDPCGPDLDLAGDEAYLNFLANAEGMLPSSFFVDGQPFDRSALDIDRQVASIESLLGRTRDLRLVALLARFLLLKDDLSGFGAALAAMASLLETHWADVHPRAEAGAFALRAAIIGTLDVPTVVFPLQFIPLCENRRLGPVSLRTHMYAVGDAIAREGENVPPQAAIQQALRDGQTEVLKRREGFVTIRNGLQRINGAWLANSDFMSAPKLDHVASIVDKILAFIEAALPGDISAGQPFEPTVDASASADRPRTAVASVDDVRLSLRAVAGYFYRLEPSSPVLPLVLQAEQLLGKSLFEVLQILVPNQLSEAAFQIGARQYFPLPVERLSGLLEAAENALQTADGIGPQAATDNDSQGATAGSDKSPDDAPASDPQQTAPAALRPIPAIAGRRHAMAVLEQVSAFLRSAEPSSPIPWLIERARALADQDFLGVLKALLPPGAMSESEQKNDDN